MQISGLLLCYVSVVINNTYIICTTAKDIERLRTSEDCKKIYFRPVDGFSGKTNNIQYHIKRKLATKSMILLRQKTTAHYKPIIHNNNRCYFAHISYNNYRKHIR